jgi:hypothetical protein
MSHRILCQTLFDITKTGILNRAKAGQDITNLDDWYNKRNTQCNLDTIIQVISLRAQPDVTNIPKLSVIKPTMLFGQNYANLQTINVWSFDFEVQHSSVFENEHSELGALYLDSENVPMIVTSTSNALDNSLQVNKSQRNIIFVKY